MEMNGAAHCTQGYYLNYVHVSLGRIEAVLSAKKKKVINIFVALVFWSEGHISVAPITIMPASNVKS